MPPFGILLWRLALGVVATGVVLVFASIGLIIIAVTRSPDTGHRWCAPRFGRCVLWLLRIPVQVTGRDHIPADRASVICVTHTSEYHLFAVCMLAPMQWRAVVTSGVKRIPLAGQVASRTGHIFLNRWDPEQAGLALETAADTVRAGKHLVMYPEGRRHRDGRAGRFRRGAFRLSLETGAPVLPLILTDARRRTGHGKYACHPGVITARFLPPIEPHDGDTDGDFRDRVRAIMVQALDEDAGDSPIV